MSRAPRLCTVGVSSPSSRLSTTSENRRGGADPAARRDGGEFRAPGGGSGGSLRTPRARRRSAWLGPFDAGAEVGSGGPPGRTPSVVRHDDAPTTAVPRTVAPERCIWSSPALATSNEDRSSWTSRTAWSACRASESAEPRGRGGAATTTTRPDAESSWSMTAVRPCWRRSSSSSPGAPSVRRIGAAVTSRSNGSMSTPTQPGAWPCGVVRLC